MEEVELRLVNSTLFCEFSKEFPEITIYRWCSSVVDYVEMYGRSAVLEQAYEKLSRIAGDINSKIVSTSNMDRHLSTGISCRCNIHNSSIRLAETLNLLWEAPAIYKGGQEILKLISFSNDDLDAFFKEASKDGTVEIVRKHRIDPDSLREVYSISLGDLFGDLSAKQADYLREAISHGMFSSPKKTKVDALARSHGISKSTMQEHINKARNKLIQALEPYLSLYIHSTE